MRLLFTGTVLSVVMLSFLSFSAWAEEPVNATTIEITVPHQVSEANVPRCETQTEGFIPITYCVIRGVAPDGSEPVWDIEKEQWTSELILEAEAKESYQTHVAAQEEASLTPEEKRIAHLEGKSNPTSQDLEELELLKRLGALCRNDTLVSQTYRS